MHPHDAHLKGIARRYLALPAALFATLGLHAREAGARPAPQGSIATLVYLAGGKPDGEPLPTWAQELSAVITQDLKESGVLRLLDPSRTLAGPEPTPDRFWKKAGADYLLRTLARPTVRGKLLMECECVQLGTQSLLLNKVFVGELQAVHRMAHRLADYVVGKVTGVPGVADSRILFARQTAPGVQEIFSADRDGKDLRKLTSFGSRSTHPALAADGRLALVTYKGGPPQIWGQTRTGGPMKKLFPLDGQGGRELSGLAWSPDGTRLAFVQEDRKGGSSIQVLDLRTSRVSPWTEVGRSAQSPSWKPDGTALAYVSNRFGVPQIFVQSPDGGQARQLTFDPDPKTTLAWSPLGDRLAYVAKVGGASGVFTLAPDGGERRPVETRTGAIEALCWAPDGRWLLLDQRDAGGSRFHLAGLDGTSRDLPDGFREGRTPQWTRNHAPIASLGPSGLATLNPAASPQGAQPLP